MFLKVINSPVESIQVDMDPTARGDKWARGIQGASREEGPLGFFQVAVFDVNLVNTIFCAREQGIVVSIRSWMAQKESRKINDITGRENGRSIGGSESGGVPITIAFQVDGFFEKEVVAFLVFGC